MDSDKKGENLICIGRKEHNQYIKSIMTQSHWFDEINIKARGNMIPKCCDVVNYSINKVLKQWFIKNIRIYSECIAKNETSSEYQERKFHKPPKERMVEVSVIHIVIEKTSNGRTD